MGFKDLKAAFQNDAENPEKFLSDEVYRYWKLRLLFEIAGNLDSLVVTHRKLESHVDRMATAYSELVQLQKGKLGK